MDFIQLYTLIFCFIIISIIIYILYYKDERLSYFFLKLMLVLIVVDLYFAFNKKVLCKFINSYKKNNCEN